MGNNGLVPSMPPQEIRDLIGSAMDESALHKWWITPSLHLYNLTPEYMWLTGRFQPGLRQHLMDFLHMAKSGDMA